MSTLNDWSGWEVFTMDRFNTWRTGNNVDGRLEFFTLDRVGNIMHIWEESQDKFPREWEYFQNVSKVSNLTVVNNQDGRLEVFVVDNKGSLQHKWQNDPNGHQGWSAWQDRKFTNDALDLAVAKNQDGRLEAFVVDKSGSVHHIWQNTHNSSWSGWGDLNFTNAASNLVVGNNKDGRLEVFVLDKSGSVHHIWQNHPNSSWSGWENISASVKNCSAIDVARNQDGCLEVFVLSDGKMKSIRQIQPNFGGWGSWVTHDFEGSSDFGFSTNLKAITNEQGIIEVYAINKDGILLHGYQKGLNSNIWIKMSLEVEINSPSQSDVNKDKLSSFDVNVNRRGGIDIFGVLATSKIILRIRRSGIKRNFVLWASNVLITNNLEHTWVESINPNDAFRCFSPFEPNRKRQLILSEATNVSHVRASYCRGTLDSCSMNYILNGYCHQAANRFLMHVGQSVNNLPKKMRPGGYVWTYFWCGPLGTSNNFKEWYQNYYLVSLSKYPRNEKTNIDENPFSPGSLNDRMLQLYLTADEKNMDSNEVIVKCTSLLLADKIANYQDGSFASKQLDMLRRRDEVLSQVGFVEGSDIALKLSKNEVTSFVEEVNELGRDLQLKLKETIGIGNYKIFTEGDETIYNLVDTDLAIEHFAK